MRKLLDTSVDCILNSSDEQPSVTQYLLSSNVQLGASYPISQTSTKLFDDGCAAVATYINASPPEVVLGPSTTQLFRNLSASLYEYITPDSSPPTRTSRKN